MGRTQSQPAIDNAFDWRWRLAGHGFDGELARFALHRSAAACLSSSCNACIDQRKRLRSGQNADEAGKYEDVPSMPFNLLWIDGYFSDGISVTEG